jgi:hypothetical protein
MVKAFRGILCFWILTLLATFAQAENCKNSDIGGYWAELKGSTSFFIVPSNKAKSLEVTTYNTEVPSFSMKENSDCSYSQTKPCGDGPGNNNPKKITRSDSVDFLNVLTCGDTHSTLYRAK